MKDRISNSVKDRITSSVKDRTTSSVKNRITKSVKDRINNSKMNNKKITSSVPGRKTFLVPRTGELILYNGGNR